MIYIELCLSQKRLIFYLGTDSAQYYFLKMNMLTWSIGADFFFSVIFIPNHDIIIMVADFMTEISSYVPLEVYCNYVHFLYFMFVARDFVRVT